MIIRAWIALIICVVWIALGEMPGWLGWPLCRRRTIALIPLLRDLDRLQIVRRQGLVLHELYARGESLRRFMSCVTVAAANRIIDECPYTLTTPQRVAEIQEKVKRSVKQVPSFC